ncbi:kinase-like protein [Atractiella rhizophila]|nr:kinase-like protein [Atractiella rhizophila]
MKFFHHSEAHIKKKEFSWGKRLGKGSYGEVTQCRWFVHPSTLTRFSALANSHNPPMEVAMKVVPRDRISRSPEEQEDGLTRLTSLEHPHCVKLFDWFTSKSSYYMIFELAAGGELYDRVERSGKFPEHLVRPMVLDLMTALSYVHHWGVIHRDLKLENIFLRTSKGPPFDCLIADFGVCRKYEWDEGHELHKMTDIVGSPGYIAPEMVERRGYGKKVDVFALGVITFLLLFGRFPFKAAINRDFVHQCRNGVKFPNSTQISADARDFLRRCLAYNQHDRPTSAEALELPWLSGSTKKAQQEPAVAPIPVEIPPPRTLETRTSSEEGEVEAVKVTENENEKHGGETMDSDDFVGSPKAVRVPTLATKCQRQF